MKRGISLLGTAALVLPVCVAMSAVLLAPRQLRADDLKLKDGSKISGTIVGFEENSFKVKTSYGFAVVQKDQVVSIAMSDAPKVAAEKSPEPAAEKTSPAEKPKSESVKAASAPPLPAMAGATAEPVAKAAPPASATKIAKIASPAPTPAPVAKTTPPAAAPVAKAQRRQQQPQFPWPAPRRPSHPRRSRFANPSTATPTRMKPIASTCTSRRPGT